MFSSHAVYLAALIAFAVTIVAFAVLSWREGTRRANRKP